MDEIDDQELIRRYLKGDKQSFELLFSRHKTRLYGYLNAQLPWASHEVDDLFQQSWIKAIKSLHSYQDKGCFGAWLIQISKNLLIDRHRKLKRKGPDLSLEAVESAWEPSSKVGSEPWRELDESELSKEIKLALKELTEEQREVFLLRQEGVSFKEIAERQNCPLNTALARMQYALKNLRTTLSQIDKGGLLQ